MDLLRFLLFFLAKQISWTEHLFHLGMVREMKTLTTNHDLLYWS